MIYYSWNIRYLAERCIRESPQTANMFSAQADRKGVIDMEKKQLIILGSGPAGLAAAIYAKRAELDVLVIEKNFVSGGQVLNTYEVDNDPGMPGINGFDMGMKFREHADNLGTAFETDVWNS